MTKLQQVWKTCFPNVYFACPSPQLYESLLYINLLVFTQQKSQFSKGIKIVIPHGNKTWCYYVLPGSH